MKPDNWELWLGKLRHTFWYNVSFREIMLISVRKFINLFLCGLWTSLCPSLTRRPKYQPGRIMLGECFLGVKNWFKITCRCESPERSTTEVEPAAPTLTSSIVSSKPQALKDQQPFTQKWSHLLLIIAGKNLKPLLKIYNYKGGNPLKQCQAISINLLNHFQNYQNVM